MMFGSERLEQFVLSVVDYSSQYSSDISVSYSALNLCGTPSNFPDYGDFPQALVTRTYGRWWFEAPSASEDFQPQNSGAIPSYDFVEIKFSKEVYPESIHIYETYNPGAVVRIWALGNKGWVKIWEGKPKSVQEKSRLFTPNIRLVNFKTRTFKLELNQEHLPDYTQLDAVLLVGSTKYQRKANKYLKELDELMNGHRMNGSPKIENLVDHVRRLGLHENLRTKIVKDIFKDISLDQILIGNFYKLPDETVIKIFKYLDTQSLCRCAQVNKSFYRISQDPLLNRCLNLKPYWHSINESVLYTIAKKATLLQKLDLSWCGDERTPSYDCFSTLISNCGSILTHLRLNSCRFVDHYTLMCITEECPNMKELSLNSCRNIKPNDFNFLSNLTNLTRLELYRARIEPQSLINIIRVNKNLQHLNLGACVYLTSMDDVAKEIGANCPNLISIDLWKNYSLTPVGMKSLTKCTNIQEIELGWCVQVGSSGEWIGELVQTCTKIKKLFIGALRGITDRDLQPLLKYSLDMEQLDLFGSAITPDICESLLKKCKKLNLLDVNVCDLISDVQVDIWRHNYPNVVIKQSRLFR